MISQELSLHGVNSWDDDVMQLQIVKPFKFQIDLLIEVNLSQLEN